MKEGPSSKTGWGAYCERTVKDLERQGCEKIRIYYHQHRGAEHESDTGVVHDHWVDVHASMLCKDERETTEGEEAEGYETQDYGVQDYGTQDGHGAAAALTPMCDGMAEGAECWKELANKPGCYVWKDYLYHDQTVSWSGQCSGGVAVGKGELAWRGSDWSGEDTGEIRDGKRHGHWVLRYADGEVEEGPYKDGKRHGRWVVRYASGSCNWGEWSYGDYVDGGGC